MSVKQRKFSIYYFLSISIYAFILAFFPIHCKVIGLSAFEIAVVTASGTLATVLGAPIAIYLAHSFYTARNVMIYSSFFSTLFYLPLLFGKDIYTLSIAWLMINCCKRASDAIVDTRALSIEENFSFERVRMWGSVGFMVTMAVLGPLVDYNGTKSILPFGMMLTLMVFCACFNLKNETENEKGKDKVNTAREELPPRLVSFFVILLIAFSLITASHSALYVYFSIYLKSMDWSASEISWAWNIGVFSEVIMFIYFKKLQKHFGLIGALWISTIITALRWLLLANYRDKSIIMLSQVLHSFSFAGCYTAAVKLITAVFPSSWRDKGQSLIISVGFGVGAVIGRLVMGHFADSLQSDFDLNLLFIISSYIALISVVLVGVLYRVNSRTSILVKKFD